VTVADLPPADLLAEADQLCRQDRPDTAGYWSRAAALLARMALESAVSARLAALHPRLPEASMRSKLLVLPLCCSQEATMEAARAWAGLSRACHQHPYELAPTRTELADLIRATRTVLAAIG
jgi:hypothetical protein